MVDFASVDCVDGTVDGVVATVDDVDGVVASVHGVDLGEALTHEQLLTLKETLSKVATNLQDKAVEEVKKKPPEVST